jgi:hypothetical protein
VMALIVNDVNNPVPTRVVGSTSLTWDGPSVTSCNSHGTLPTPASNGSRRQAFSNQTATSRRTDGPSSSPTCSGGRITGC